MRRDWDYFLIQVTFLVLGNYLFYLLATHTVLLPEKDDAPPERYARIVIGSSSGPPSVKPGNLKAPKKVPLKKLAPTRPKKPRISRAELARRAQIRAQKRRTKLLSQSLVGVIATRSKTADSALGKILQKGGIGSQVDKALKGVKNTGGGARSGAPNVSSRGTSGQLQGTDVGEIGGVGTGYGGGGDNVDLGYRTAHTVTAKLTRGRASIEGALDAALIEKVVRKNLAGLKYCYEKELNKKPKLAGKIVIQFTIGLAGRVTQSAVESSSMGNASVEQCVVRRIRRWRFPRPEGGAVAVSYPFVFTASN